MQGTLHQQAGAATGEPAPWHLLHCSSRQTWHSNVLLCVEASCCVLWQVLRLLIKLYESVDSPDWASICQCLMFLDDAAEVAKILARLLKGSQVRLRGLTAAYFLYSRFA